MEDNPHFKELLQRFYEAGVEFLIVGGYAVMKYGEPRYTKDLDVWVGASSVNAAKVFRALTEFGAPLESDGITPDTFAEPDVVYQIGVAPIRIDILTAITGLRFEDAWRNRVPGMMFGVPVHFLSLDDLIANKQAIGRESDVEQLRNLAKGQNNRS